MAQQFALLVIVRNKLEAAFKRASITARRSSAILAFMVQLARTPASMNASNSRQTPTRWPYSRQEKLGKSGMFPGSISGRIAGPPA